MYKQQSTLNNSGNQSSNTKLIEKEIAEVYWKQYCKKSIRIHLLKNAGQKN